MKVFNKDKFTIVNFAGGVKPSDKNYCMNHCKGGGLYE